jgi:hypothetical protein
MARKGKKQTKSKRSDLFDAVGGRLSAPPYLKAFLEEVEEEEPATPKRASLPRAKTQSARSRKTWTFAPSFGKSHYHGAGSGDLSLLRHVLRLFRIGHNRAAPIEGRNAIFPGYVAQVVRKADDGERELVNLNSGFVLLQKGLAPQRVTNVRDDKILTSNFWHPSFEQRRCLVPASSYSAPKGEKPA